ncbi:MAG: anti-sigma factor family protein [Chloroflexota bacterium]
MKHQHKQECNELLGSISDYVDGSLREELCRELERHLSECDDCRVVVDTMKKTIDLYQTETVREGLPADVRQRLFKSLHLDDLLHSAH